MKLLLTGFDPFGGEPINPAWEAVKRVSDQVGDVEVVKLMVPTVFYKSIDTVAAAIEKDARIPDNEGNQPLDGPVFEDGETAYFATLPIKAMAEEIRKAGVPASVSNTAGTYVCNHLMYGVLYTLANKYPDVRGGFMHVPFITSQVINRKPIAPSLSLEQIVTGIEAAVKAIGENQEDIKTVEGQTH